MQDWNAEVIVHTMGGECTWYEQIIEQKVRLVDSDVNYSHVSYVNLYTYNTPY